MPLPEEIIAAKKVLGLKANPTSRSEDITKAKQDFINTKIRAAKAALNSSNPNDQIEAANEAGEEGVHPEGCKCTDCCEHPADCKCGCQDHEEAGEEHPYTCDCSECKAEKQRRHDYIEDHGGDEDAEDHDGIDDYYNFTPGKEVEFEYKGKKFYGKIKDPESIRTENTPQAESILTDWNQLDPEDQKVQFIIGTGSTYYIIDPNDTSFAPMKNLSPMHPKFSFQRNESTQITNFIKAISQKNYASANKYLQGVVESKLKRSISKAANK
jgi:hypothetical protein